MTNANDRPASRRQVLAAAGATVAVAVTTQLAAAQQAATRAATSPAIQPRAKPPEMPDVEKAPRPLSVLILGGTGFIGPYEVQHARARGHKVTIANRGKSRPEMFEGLDVAHLEYDRDAEPTALRDAVAAGQKWDVVIDNIGYLPGHVTTPAGILKDAVKQYIFVSTVSVYQSRGEGPTEDSPKEEITADEAAGATMKDVGKWYGALKVYCELAAEQTMPGRTTIVRPGLIVGPSDPTDRFTYWPARVVNEARCGGKMLVPGTREEPAQVQVIDVRDLAAFICTVAENNNTAIFNLVGPTETLPKVVDAAKAHANAKTELVFVPMKFLADNNVAFWQELPMVVPAEGESAGFARTSNAAALAAGLTLRPIEETTRDTIDWWQTLTPQRQAMMDSDRNPALKAAKEQELLEKWAQQER